MSFVQCPCNTVDVPNQTNIWQRVHGALYSRSALVTPPLVRLCVGDEHQFQGESQEACICRLNFGLPMKLQA